MLPGIVQPQENPDLTATDAMRHGSPSGENPAQLLAEVETLGGRLTVVRDRIGRIIFGQQEVVDLTLITLLAGGHVLLIGVPGLAKTKLVVNLGYVLELADKQYQ